MHNHQTVWNSIWRGICQGRYETDIPAGFFKDMLDFYVTARGAIAPRPGYRKYARTPDSRPAIAVFPVDWDGSLYTFISTSHNVYLLRTDELGAPAWTLLHTWTTTSTRVSFAPINQNTSPHIVFGNGTDSMLKYDGTTTTALPADAPKGLPVAYKNYLAVYGIAGAPGRVQFNINNGDTATWLYGGVPRTLEVQGTVTALYPFTGLMIFTEKRAEIFAGDPDAIQGVSVLSEVVGCVEAKAMAEAEGMLVWLSYSGVVYWNGSGVFPTGILSNQEGERISNISEDMHRIAWSQKSAFSMAFNPLLRHLYAVVKLARLDLSGYDYRTYVFDMQTQSWFPWSLEAQRIAVSVSPESSEVRTLAALDDGTIAYQEMSQATPLCKDQKWASEREFDYFLVSGSTDFGTTEFDKTVRAVTLRVSPANGSQGIREIPMTFRGDFLETGIAIMTQLRFGFVLGIGQLGDFLSGSADVEKRSPVAIRSKYFSWAISGKGEINSMPIQAMGISFRPHSNRSIMVWNRDI